MNPYGYPVRVSSRRLAAEMLVYALVITGVFGLAEFVGIHYSQSLVVVFVVAAGGYYNGARR